MGAIEHLTISLSAEAARRLHVRVESGDYADANAVMEHALAALDAFDSEIASVLPETDEAEVEQWLRTEVVAIYDEMERDPARGIPLEDVIAQFQAERIARGE